MLFPKNTRLTYFRGVTMKTGEMLQTTLKKKKVLKFGKSICKDDICIIYFRFSWGCKGYSAIKRVTASICHSCQPPSTNLITFFSQLCAKNVMQVSKWGTVLLLSCSVHREHQKTFNRAAFLH